MKMELSSRDKRTLTGLGVFVLVVCIGYWGILPQLRTMRECKEKIEEIELKSALLDSKCSQVYMVEAFNEKTEAMTEAEKKEFFPLMDNDGVGRYVTDMLMDDYGFEIKELVIGERASAGLQPYQYSEKNLTGAGKAYDNAVLAAAPIIDEISDDPFRDELEIEAAEDVVYMVPVYVRLTRDSGSFGKLLDDLAGTAKKIRLVESEMEEDLFQLSFELYMTDKEA